MSGAASKASVRGKAARARCGASVREGQNQQPDPTERATAQRRGLCGAPGRQGGCRYSTQPPRQPLPWRNVTIGAIPTIPQASNLKG